MPPPPDHAQDPPNRKGYDLLVQALLSMMDVGTSYHLQARELPERVLLATSAHQCFSLAMGMLGALPPGYHVLTAMVEGEGLSVTVSGWGVWLLWAFDLSCFKFLVLWPWTVL